MSVFVGKPEWDRLPAISIEAVKTDIVQRGPFMMMGLAVPVLPRRGD